MLDIDSHRPIDEANLLLRERLLPLTLGVQFELVTKRAFTGIVEVDRVRIWPVGPSGGEDGMWHQWRPVFNGAWAVRNGSTHLIGT